MVWLSMEKFWTSIVTCQFTYQKLLKIVSHLVNQTSAKMVRDASSSGVISNVCAKINGRIKEHFAKQVNILFYLFYSDLAYE